MKFFVKLKQDLIHYSQQQLDELTAMILFGLPGEKKIIDTEVLDKLDWYKNVDHAALRENLKYFLSKFHLLLMK